MLHRRGRDSSQPSALRSRRVRLVSFLGALAVASGLAGVLASPASAYSRGCGFWNPFTANGVPLAGGQYCAEVDGSGTWLYQVEGDFVSAGNVCNWDITAEVFDDHWRWKKTFVSAHDYGCTHAGRKYIPLPYYISQLTGTNNGYVCSTLRAGYQRVTSVCHYIHP
jgi:hypothetical protein